MGPWERYAAPAEGPWSAYSQEKPTPVAVGKEGFAKAVKDEFNDRNWADRQIISAGTALGNLIERGKQVVGRGDPQAIEANRVMASEAPVSAFLGNAAMFAPTAMIPGANTYTGAALIGGGIGASQPTIGDESTLRNIAIGAGGGAVGKGLGDAISAGVSRATASNAARQAQNATRDATLAQTRQAGYVMPPSMAEAGVGSRLLEGLSGKYKTNQLATIKNQPVTDDLAKASVGLGKSDELSVGALKRIRESAFNNGYTPVRNAGSVTTDSTFTKSLDDIVSKYTGAVKSFPGAADDTITPIVAGVKVKQFDAADGVDMIRILRERADDAFGSGNKAAGKANREAAQAIEEQLERHLQAQGNTGALDAFREARKTIAKTYTIEGALEKSTGRVDAKKIGKALERGKPLSGELETIGKFGSAYKDVAGIPKSGNANPFTIMDYAVGTGLGVGVNPVLAALPAARYGARQAILSAPYQQAFVNPQYGLGILGQLGRGVGPVMPIAAAGGALETFR